MGFRGDILPHRDRCDTRPKLGDLSAQFMADDARRMDAVLRPLVPSIDVGVGSAQGGGANTDQYFPFAGPRIGDML
jgi:hypothetical protein